MGAVTNRRNARGMSARPDCRQTARFSTYRWMGPTDRPTTFGGMASSEPDLRSAEDATRELQKALAHLKRLVAVREGRAPAIEEGEAARDSERAAAERVRFWVRRHRGSGSSGR